jgi:hypothetical protein
MSTYNRAQDEGACVAVRALTYHIYRVSHTYAA